MLFLPKVSTQSHLSMEKVILVDENDQEVGAMEKLEAHEKGLLHRAFSVLLFNSKGEMLLQKRAKSKYHSAGLCSNACCSHPRPGEHIEAAVKRRMMEELGVDVKTDFSHKFIYNISFPNNLIEYEFDHVFTGLFDGRPMINSEEIEDWKYVNIRELSTEIRLHPENYTHWFKIILSADLKISTLQQGRAC